MLYKKQILERYNKMNDHKLQDEPPPKSNEFDNYDNCNQSRYKNNILKIYNSSSSSSLINKKSILMKHKVIKPKLCLVVLYLSPGFPSPTTKNMKYQKLN